MDIRFLKLEHQYLSVIQNWLAEPHVQEFWDNSQGHKDDIIKFVNGRTEPSDYCDGLFSYWIGFIEEIPYCLIMTLTEKHEYDIPPLKKKYLSSTGNTISIDFMIGNKDYFSKGLGAITLKKFTEFYSQEYDKNADTFYIDPDLSNPRAKHVYEKAGFEHVGDFIMDGDGVFKGKLTHFMIKKVHKK